MENIRKESVSLIIKTNTKKTGPGQNKSNNKEIISGPVYVTNGAFEGEVNLQWDAVKKANHYVIEISKSTTGWQQLDIVSDPQYSIDGLKTGKTYLFRIAAISAYGQGPWSEAVTKKIK